MPGLTVITIYFNENIIIDDSEAVQIIFRNARSLQEIPYLYQRLKIKKSNTKITVLSRSILNRSGVL
jgi:uncharacterized protein YqjF (DUF2071 family)